MATDERDLPDAEQAAKEYEETKRRVIEGRASVHEAQEFIDFIEGAATCTGGATDEREWTYFPLDPESDSERKKGVMVVPKCRAVAAEQRVRELEGARKRDLDYCQALDRDLTKALEKAKAAEVKLATAVEALKRIGSHAAGSYDASDHGRMLGAIAEDADQALSKIEGGEQS